MAYSWNSNEKAYITLGKPYAFTKKQYEYCKIRNAPIAIIYYDTKTSIISKELYSYIFKIKDNIKKLQQKLSSYKILDINSDKFKGGYCCLFVLDRCGQIQTENEDQNYFINEILKKSDANLNNQPFITLILSYNEKISCHQFPISTTIEDFSNNLYEKCESEKNDVPKFSSWSNRQTWLDHQLKIPELEIKPAKTGKDNLNTNFGTWDFPPYYHDITAKKTYEDYDNDYSGEFKNIEHGNHRPNVSYLLNLADISTPETTYYLQGAYDDNGVKHYSPVKQADEVLRPIIEKNCDNIVSLWDYDCRDGKFTKAFQDGKKYRFFIFHEQSHGNNGYITIDSGFTNNTAWNVFKDMRSYQRVWGLFDSCHDGSMIAHPGIQHKSFSFANHINDKQLTLSSINKNINNDPGILNYIINKLNRRAELFNYFTKNNKNNKNNILFKSTVPQPTAAIDVRMILQSATGPNSYSWYNPTSSTFFLKAINSALNTNYWNIDNKNYIYVSTRYGWSQSSDDSYWDEKDSLISKYKGQYVIFQIMKCLSPKDRRGSPGYGKEPPIKMIHIPQCKIYPTNDSFETNIVFY